MRNAETELAVMRESATRRFIVNVLRATTFLDLIAGIIGMLLIVCHIMAKAGEAVNVTTEQGTCEVTEIAGQLIERAERKIVYLHDEEVKDYTTALNDAVRALSQQCKTQGSRARIEPALEQLEKGDPRAAELILAELVEREASRGKEGLERAAEIQLHLAAFAYLHDAQAAWAAYTRAVTFDSENADGWNRLGYCAVSCIHDWGEAEKAFQKLIDIGRLRNDPTLMVRGYRNLGSMYKAREFVSRAPFFNDLKGTKGIPKEYNPRDDRARAVIMYRKALDIYADIGEAAKPDEISIKSQLTAFIEAARTVTADNIAMKGSLSFLYGMIAPPTKQYLDDYYRASNPFKRAKRELIAVDVEAVLPVSKDTYQISWSENARDLQGRQSGETHWLANLTILIQAPRTEADIIKKRNPFGIYVSTLSWTQKL